MLKWTMVILALCAAEPARADPDLTLRMLAELQVWPEICGELTGDEVAFRNATAHARFLLEETLPGGPLYRELTREQKLAEQRVKLGANSPAEQRALACREAVAAYGPDGTSYPGIVFPGYERASPFMKAAATAIALTRRCPDWWLKRQKLLAYSKADGVAEADIQSVYEFASRFSKRVEADLQPSMCEQAEKEFGPHGTVLPGLLGWKGT